MGKASIFVLFLFSCSFFTASRADEIEFETIRKALSSLTNVVEKYHSAFDTKVKFGPLQDVIDTISESMLDYLGTAKHHMDRIRSLNSAARLKYQDCVGPVFEWCLALNSTLEFFIPYLTDNGLSSIEKNIIFNMNLDALNEGQHRAQVSLELLKEVQVKMAELKNLLDTMLNDLHNDFGPYGFYGKQKEQLTNAIEENRRARKSFFGFIRFVFAAIKAIVLGPIGRLLGVPSLYNRLGLQSILRGEKEATYEQQLKVIYAFYDFLDQKIREATQIAAEVEVDLKEDKSNLYALKGMMNGANRTSNNLLNSTPNLRRLLIPIFQNLGNACYKYTIWHGYGSSAYSHKNVRTRREASESCKEQWLKTMETAPYVNGAVDNSVFHTEALVEYLNCEFPPSRSKELEPELHLPIEKFGAISKDFVDSSSGPSGTRLSQPSKVAASSNLIANYVKYFN